MKKFNMTLILILALAGFSNVFAASELTLNSETTFEPTHTNRFTFMAGVNSSLTKSADMSNIVISYGKKLDDYWLDSNLLMTKGLASKFSANNPTATGATDDQLLEQKNTLTTLGIGIGRETRYAQTLLPFTDIYELMAANITYNSYKETFSGSTFSGPGILAKFEVYKKFNDYISAGAHFNYNISVVKRTAANEEETNSQRSLTLGFLTLGLNISIYL